MSTSFPMCLMALSHQKPFPVALPNGLGSATCCLTQWRTREGSHRCRVSSLSQASQVLLPVQDCSTPDKLTVLCKDGIRIRAQWGMSRTARSELNQFLLPSISYIFVLMAPIMTYFFPLTCFRFLWKSIETP